MILTEGPTSTAQSWSRHWIPGRDAHRYPLRTSRKTEASLCLITVRMGTQKSLSRSGRCPLLKYWDVQKFLPESSLGGPLQRALPVVHSHCLCIRFLGALPRPSAACTFVGRAVWTRQSFPDSCRPTRPSLLEPLGRGQDKDPREHVQKVSQTSFRSTGMSRGLHSHGFGFRFLGALARSSAAYTFVCRAPFTGEYVSNYSGSCGATRRHGQDTDLRSSRYPLSEEQGCPEGCTVMVLDCPRRVTSVQVQRFVYIRRPRPLPQVNT